MDALQVTELDRIAATLSAIAYIGVDDSPEKRFREIAQALQLRVLPTRQQWGLVWGPHERDQILCFIAQGPPLTAADTEAVDARLGRGRRYAVVFRGTVESIFNYFVDGDVDGQSELPWNDPDFPGAMISNGSFDAMQKVFKLHQIVRGERVHLVDFLAGVEPGSSILVTGHSLGGNLASVAAAWLRAELAARGQQVLIHPVTFAAPSAGNRAFATQFTHVFASSKRYFNANDVVPKAWSYRDLESIRQLYPGTGAPKCDYENGCQFMVDTAEIAAGHAYEQPGRDCRLTAGLYSESGWLEFFDEVGAQHSALLYMWLLGIGLDAISALYPDLNWQPPP
jgi:hypothetical protein